MCARPGVRATGQMKEIGTIVDFTDEGKAVVEFNDKGAACAGCPSGAFCAQSGGKRRMVLDIISGVARGTQVYVEIGPRSLLKMPALACVMVASFIGGAVLGQIVFKAVFGVRQPDILSLLAGLVVTAAAIFGRSAFENRRNKREFAPHIAGVVWKGQ